jgi:hypothetical protein
MVKNMNMNFYGLIDLLWQPSPTTTSTAHLEMASLINFKKPFINNIFPKPQQPLTTFNPVSLCRPASQMQE